MSSWFTAPERFTAQTGYVSHTAQTLSSATGCKWQLSCAGSPAVTPVQPSVRAGPSAGGLASEAKAGKPETGSQKRARKAQEDSGSDKNR